MRILGLVAIAIIMMFNGVAYAGTTFYSSAVDFGTPSSQILWSSLGPNGIQLQTSFTVQSTDSGLSALVNVCCQTPTGHPQAFGQGASDWAGRDILATNDVGWVTIDFSRPITAFGAYVDFPAYYAGGFGWLSNLLVFSDNSYTFNIGSIVVNGNDPGSNPYHQFLGVKSTSGFLRVGLGTAIHCCATYDFAVADVVLDTTIPSSVPEVPAIYLLIFGEFPLYLRLRRSMRQQQKPAYNWSQDERFLQAPSGGA